MENPNIGELINRSNELYQQNQILLDKLNNIKIERNKLQYTNNDLLEKVICLKNAFDVMNKLVQNI